jgi:hypothetical protein
MRLMQYCSLTPPTREAELWHVSRQDWREIMQEATAVSVDANGCGGSIDCYRSTRCNH